MNQLFSVLWAFGSVGFWNSLFWLVSATITKKSKKKAVYCLLICFVLMMTVPLATDDNSSLSTIWAGPFLFGVFVSPALIIRYYHRHSAGYVRSAEEKAARERLLECQMEEEKRVREHAQWEIMNKQKLEEEKRKALREKLERERIAEVQRFRQDIADVRQTPPDATDFSKMNGYEFEWYCAEALRKRNYTAVDVTPKSGDFGADILARDPDGRSICFQCKKYQSPVGVKAVQEIISARSYYHCDLAAVITNASYTDQARELAAETDVLLMEIGRTKDRIIYL